MEREDIPTFVRWFNDPEVRRYLMMYGPMSRAQEEQWFERMLGRTDEFLFAIEAAVAHGWTHIGNLGLHRVDWKNRTATLGMVLGEKEYWGKGYGTDAGSVVLRFAFHELNLHRVELETYSFNPRAMRCYEKLGFIQEGVRRKALYREGQYHDVHTLGLLRDEYESSSS